MVTLGIDIGGTKLAAGLVDEHGQVLHRTLRPSPSGSAREVEDAILQIHAELSTHADIEAVGIGAAGWVDDRQSVVCFSPHLAWRDEPLKERLERHLTVPVLIDNDANAAAWGEYRFGAGRDAAVLVMVNLGTGIGGAMLVNGSLFRGRYGMAGEFGHMQVVPDGHWCPCGNRGCWEQYASGNSLARDARDLIDARAPQGASLLRHVPGGRPEDLRGQHVTAAALAGDTVAIELVQDLGTWLGRGLANLAAALDPDRFVIGGGVAALGDLLLDAARTTFERSLTGRGFRRAADLRLAAHGNEAGLIGAADLARRSLTDPPGRTTGLWPVQGT